MNKKYSIALKEKPLDSGLTRAEVCDLFDMLNDTEGFPLDFEGSGSVAMGFISAKDAEAIDYDFKALSDLEEMIEEILSDMDNENPDCEYTFRSGDNELSIWLSR